MKRKRVLNVEGARVTLAPKLQRRSNASLNARQPLCYKMCNTHGRSRYGMVNLCAFVTTDSLATKAQSVTANDQKQFTPRRALYRYRQLARYHFCERDEFESEAEKSTVQYINPAIECIRFF